MEQHVEGNANMYIKVALFLLALFGLAVMSGSNQSSNDGIDNKLSLFWNGNGVVYKDRCGDFVTKTQICSVEITHNNNSHAIARIHYHYIKGAEDSNRIFVSADQGVFDNKIGVSSVFSALPGDNIIDIKFGLFDPDGFIDKPYRSDFLNIEIRGTDDVKNIYLPSIVMLNIDYSKKWLKQSN